MTEMSRLINSDDPCCMSENKERAAKILSAVEGMSVLAARDLLKECCDSLELLEICFTNHDPHEGLQEQIEALEKRVLALECWHTPQGCTQKEKEDMLRRAVER